MDPALPSGERREWDHAPLRRLAIDNRRIGLSSDQGSSPPARSAIRLRTG
jgi:hypothetical protein